MNEALVKIHNNCISKNLPFVTFRLPQKDHSVTYIQTSQGITRWKSIREISSQKGFIMAPFDTRNGANYILVKPDLIIEGHNISPDQLSVVESLESRQQPDWPEAYPVVTGKEAYMEQVEGIRTSISTGAFQKAVLSRIMVIEGDYFSIIARLFQSICKKHPNAFVYLLKSDEHFWIGASPEPLMRLREGRVSTVSLAGTRPYAKAHLDVNRWTVKEVLEQEYVTRYIHDVLRRFDIRDYRVSSPYVRKAGNLVHLCTDFSFEFEAIGKRLWDFVNAMHPTPAVAGHPKDDAIDYIKKLEPHDRDYYTGFLGPVISNDTIDLFVNLRCLKINPNYLSLFIGGGIVLDSNPADEWNETLWKAEGLLWVLRSYIKNLTSANGS
ncbi:MAG TPA: hypothetical protein ENI20_16115 [Bacteroides sp.]|nr:hypothetical protein [Bacteroides sp.]